MTKDQADQMIAILKEIRDLAQHQAQYLQEIRDKVAGAPLEAVEQKPSPARRGTRKLKGA